VDDQTRRLLSSITNIGLGASLGASVAMGVSFYRQHLSDVEPGLHGHQTIAWGAQTRSSCI